MSFDNTKQLYEQQVAERTQGQVSRLDNSTAAKLLGASAGMLVTMLSLFDNKIWLGNAFEEGVLHRRNMLIDVNALNQKRMLGASGTKEGMEAAAHIKPWGKTFEEALRVKKQIDDLHERTGVPVSRLLGAAATGTPTVPHEYELVRRANYLAEVKGPQYYLQFYNAINGVTVKPTTDLNVIGFARAGLLTGQKEIGDNQIPDVAKNTFTSYFKDIYADAFRYEFGMREKKDSVFDIEGQVTQDIAGLFAKLKDNKITTGMNAIADTTPTTNWAALLATYETHYTSDAAEDVENEDKNLRDYGGAFAAFFPRAVGRAYLKNVNATPRIDMNTIGKPVSQERTLSYPLPFNEGITGYVNDDITAATMVILARQWGVCFQGPTIQVTYTNQFSPAQMQGRIYFDFNGFKETVAAAGKQIVGLLS